MDFDRDKQTTIWNNQTTVHTPFTKVHTCNQGTQQATKWLLVTSKAPVAGHTTNWTQNVPTPMLDIGLKLTRKLTLLGAVGKPPKEGHVAFTSQYRQLPAVQSCIASTRTTDSSLLASKQSFDGPSSTK
jgi:hypothetical protein